MKRLDASQRPLYLMFCIQRWLSLTLSLPVAGLAIVLVSSETQFKHQTSDIAINIALLNIIQFSSNMTRLVEQWTQMETSIGAIARLNRLEADVKSEDSEDENHSPSEVHNSSELPPSQGTMVFSNISASYTPDSPNVWNNFALSFQACSKVGICG